MKCLSRDESPRSSPIPDFQGKSKDIQKRIKQIHKQTTQINVVEELSKHAKTYPTQRRYSHRLMTISLRIFLHQLQLMKFWHFFFLYLAFELCFISKNNYLTIFKHS